jgi:hypothetical protein
MSSNEDYVDSLIKNSAADPSHFPYLFLVDPDLDPTY